jgi:methylmalonyl-CoA epimerase
VNNLKGGKRVIKKIDHVCVVVSDIEKAMELYRVAFGLSPLPVEVHQELGIKICLIPIGEVMIEFVQPLESNTKGMQLLKEKGGGLHHIAFRVEDIEKAMGNVQSKGFKLRDKKSRPGAAGSRIAFVETDDVTFTPVELVERPNPE